MREADSHPISAFSLDIRKRPKSVYKVRFLLKCWCRRASCQTSCIAYWNERAAQWGTSNEIVG